MLPIAVLATVHFVGCPGEIAVFMLSDRSIATSTFGAMVSAPRIAPPQPQRPLSQCSWPTQFRSPSHSPCGTLIAHVPFVWQ